MASVSEIRLRVLESAKAAADLGRVERAVQGVDHSTDRASRSAGRFTNRMGGLKLGLGGVAKGLIGFTGALTVFDQLKSSVNVTQTIERNVMGLGRAMNASEQDVGRWAGILASRNIDVTRFSMGLTRLAATVQSARGGNKDAARLLRDMGVSAEALRRGYTPELLRDIADGYKAAPDKMKRAADMQKLFGRSAKDLAPLLAAGAKGLDEQARMMDRYGITAAVGGNGTKDLIKAQRESQIAMLGFQLMLGQKVIPAMVWLQQRFVALMVKVKVATDWMQRHRAVVQTVVGVIIALGSALLVYRAVNTLTDSVKALNLVARANPWMLVITALAAVAAGLIYAYKNSKTFRDWVNRLWDAAKIAFGGLAGAWGWVSAKAEEAWRIIGPIIRRIIDGFNTIKSLMPGQGASLSAGQFTTSIQAAGAGASLRTGADSITRGIQAIPATPSKGSKEFGAGGDTVSNIHVTATLDGEVIASKVIRHVARKAARR